MVEAKNASEFRTIVQELTGQYSNIDQEDHHHHQYHDEYDHDKLGGEEEFDALSAGKDGGHNWFHQGDHYPVLLQQNDEDYNNDPTVIDVNHVAENISSNTTSTSTNSSSSSHHHRDDHDHHQLLLLEPFQDEQAYNIDHHYLWRPELQLSDNEFQSPCVFVG
ncbi:hypothetical protein CsatB_028906 [Cannabis sativa]